MAATWNPVEMTFEAADPPGDPYGQEVLDVRFEHESGTTTVVPAFWDGGDVFRVRFAPSETGTWTWESLTDDPGLEATGSFVADAGDADSALHEHGYLQAGERALYHTDGEPFFWLADTAWTASTRATVEEWEQYLNYRVEQGYNVVQVNALRQHDGSRPHDRLPFENWDLSRPNLEYFRHLDELVSMAHDRGVVPALVALWFEYAGENLDWGISAESRHEHSPEQARTLGRYLGARYGAYGAAWLVSGDSEFGESSVAIYRAAAEALGDACQYPLRTAHQPGGQNTPALVNDEAWLDFHMYQSGHTHDLAVPESQARANRALHPARPVLNGEPCYADMQGYASDEVFDRETVRAAGWLSVLAGANAGLTYGALGVWPWHRTGDTFGSAGLWGDPKPWDEAMKLPSADDYARLAAFVGERRVESLSPRPDLLAESATGEAAAVTPDAVLVYLRDGRAVTLRDAPPVTAWEWRDPATGETTGAEASDTDDLEITAPPFDGDAVLVGNRGR
ncbi:apiosidase-like domain-containing protein [Halosimplex sp. J119]